MDNQTMAFTDYERMIYFLKHSKTNEEIDFVESQIGDFRNGYSGLIPNEKLESLLDGLGLWVNCWRILLPEKIRRQTEADELINRALNRNK